MELDLSAPLLKGSNDVPLTLPDLGFAPGADSRQPVVSAAELTDEQWMALARNSDMLNGLDLVSFFEGEASAPKESFLPVLWWKVPESKEFFNCEHLSARVNTEITYTAESATYGFSRLYLHCCERKHPMGERFCCPRKQLQEGGGEQEKHNVHRGDLRF